MCTPRSTFMTSALLGIESNFLVGVAYKSDILCIIIIHGDMRWASRFPFILTIHKGNRNITAIIFYV